jgi:GT2 family glycosyltransferase/glycosyltransferase involved in cell wall biosynthesis
MQWGFLINRIAVPQRALDARVMWWALRGLRFLSRCLGRPHALLGFELLLTQRLGLFDRDFYLSQLAAGQLEPGMSPLRHYLLHGDAAGLSPHALFDLPHFDAHSGPRYGLNRLLHYGLVARFQGVAPTPWFDADYYRRSNPDVAQSSMDAFAHFLRYGWDEGRSPLPGLDMHRLMQLRQGLRARASVAADVQATMAASIQQLLSAGAAQPDALPDVLDPSVWAQVTPRQWSAAPQVDVLIPVYAGLRETLRCLWTVLNAPVDTPHRVLVVNDAGPVAELNALIRSLAARDLFVLVQHTSNQGFVKTVNHGLRLAGTHDVVILNSDTEVYGNWLDRLLAHAAQHPRLGTLTPLSNNATICSYPQTLTDNRLPLELSHAELDALAAQVNAGRHVVAPTGVGFCMYIRQTALREVGWLDERRFGRGYGEENDLCQRLLRKGWENGLACDVYVRHVGSVSFQAEAGPRVRQGLKTLTRLHPSYSADIARYIADDPARPYRARLDLARLARLSTSRNVLLVCHNRGGGTERHLLEQTRQLVNQGYGVFELRPSVQPGPRVALLHARLLGLHNLAALELYPADLFDEALRVLRITELHLHHLIDFSADFGKLLMAAARRHGLRVRLAVHDYHLVCPRVNLVNAAGHYCGEPSVADCNHCLQQSPRVAQVESIERWRQASADVLAAAAQVVVPSADVARRLAALVPGIALEVEPHEQEAPGGLRSHRAAGPEEPVRILVIGAINQIKGLDVLLRLMPYVRAEQPRCELALLGYSSDDAALAAAGVQLLGRYFDEQLQERIAQVNPHLIFIPSIWPETYCYALSGALCSGHKVAVFDLGAQAERAREHDPRHLLLPLSQAQQAQTLLSSLLTGARTP